MNKTKAIRNTIVTLGVGIALVVFSQMPQSPKFLTQAVDGVGDSISSAVGDIELDKKVVAGAVALVVIAVLVPIYKAVLSVLARRRRKSGIDPVRMYPADIRRAVFENAGGTCEYMSSWFSRCSQPAQHADHFIPWSQGGATSELNCVASCARHNTSKGAKLFPRRAARRLEVRRSRYFPAGADTRVGETYRQIVERQR